MAGEQRRARVVLMTEGSRGDHQPYIALARTLQREFDVTLVVNDGFQEMAREYGVKEVHHFQFNFQKEAGEVMQGMVGITDGAQLAEVWMPLFDGLFPTRSKEVISFAKDRDVILAAPTVLSFAAVAAEACKMPLISLPLQPSYPTNAWPPIIQDPDGMTCKESHYALMETFLAGMGPAFDAWRAVLGLPKLTARETLDSWHAHPSCCGYSRLLVPHPEDMPRQAEHVGYWILDREDLVEFLAAADTPPIYVGFGSMHFEQSDELTKHVMEAISTLGERAILCEGWNTLKPLPEYDRSRFLFVKDVYHPGLLPRCKLAVIHGGAGTTAAVVHAGIPALICPFIADQPFWASMVRNAGVGHRGPKAGDITAESLAGAIRALLADDDVALKAKKFAAELAEEGTHSHLAVAKRIRSVLEQQQHQQ